LSKTTTEIFNDKVNLIYEFDKRSPLFVRMANTEIEKNNIKKAIEILNSGLKGYPDYAAANILLGKAYTLLGNYGKALQNIKTGCDIIHSQKTYEFYLNEIENIKKQRSLFELSRRKSFMPPAEEIEKNSSEPSLFEPEKGEEKKPHKFEEQLYKLAEEISHAKMPEAANQSADSESGDSANNISFVNENLIVSETLAKIYIAQGEYNEAIIVFQKLKKKNPGKTDYYDEKIIELKKQIDS